MSASASRVSWAVLDQALSSATNVAVALVVARTLGLDALGGFAVAFAVFTLAIELSRAMGVEALAIRVRDEEPAAGLAGVVSVASLVGALTAVGCLGVGVPVAGPVGDALVAMAVFVPFAVVQDALRNGFIAVGQSRRAVVSDGIWVTVQLITLAWLVGRPNPSAGAAVAAWGLAAAAAAGGALLLFGVSIRPGLALAWLRRSGELWPRLLGEAVLRAGLFQVTLVAMAAVAGLAEIGRLRAAQVVFGPVTMAVLLAPLVAVPEAARRGTVGAIRRVSLLTSAILVGLTVTVAALTYVIPEGVGRLLLGANWPEVRALLPAVAAMVATSGLVTGAFVGLRAHARVDLTLGVRAVSGPAVLASGVAAAASSGVGAAATAIAVCRGVAGAISWRLLWRQDVDGRVSAPHAPVPLTGGRPG